MSKVFKPLTKELVDGKNVTCPKCLETTFWEVGNYYLEKDVLSAVRGLLQERELAQLNNDIFRKSVDEVQDDWIDAVNKWFKGVIK